MKSPARLTLIGLALGLLASTVPALPAAASEGSVPAEVTAYVTDGLVADLNELYGVDAAGNGVDFTDKTTAASPSRVFVFTDDFLAGTSTDEPVRRVNQWVTGISIDAVPVGYATVTIDEGTTLPTLDDFVASPDFVAVLAAVPATATLVRDGTHNAWLSLADATITPLIAGTTGLTAPVPLADYLDAVATRSSATPVPAESSDGGLLPSLLALLLAVVVIVAALLLLALRRSRRAAKILALEVELRERERIERAEKERLEREAADRARAELEAAASAQPATRKPATRKPAARKPATKPRAPRPKPPTTD